MASSNEQIFSSQNKEKKKEKKRIKAQRALMQASFTECKSTSDTSNCSPGNFTDRTGNSQLYLSTDDLDVKYNLDSKDVPCAASKNISGLNNKTIAPKQECDPFYEEDVIDGFAILSFSSYKDLEETVQIFEKTSQLPDPYQQLETKENVKKSKQEKCKQARVNGAVRNWLTKESGVGKSGHNGDRDKAGLETKNLPSGRITPNSCSSQPNTTQGPLDDCETEPKQAQVEARPRLTPSPRHPDSKVAPLPSNPTVANSAGTGSTDISNSVRWVGLASSPRPATAVAPHGPIQGGPRLPDCQPTEGGAGPSPAPPATYSPQLPAQSTSNSPTGIIQPSSPHTMNPSYRGNHPPHATVFSASSLCTAPPTSIGHQSFFPSPSPSGSLATPLAPVAPPTANFLAPEGRHREILPPTTTSAVAASLGNRLMRPSFIGPQPSVSPVSRAPPVNISSQSYSPSFPQIPMNQGYLGAHHARPAPRIPAIPTTPAGLLAPSPPTGPHRHTPVSSAPPTDPRSIQASPAPNPRPPTTEVPLPAQSRTPVQTSRPLTNYPPVPPAFHAPPLSSWPRLPQPEMYSSPNLGPRLPVSTSAGPERFMSPRDVPMPATSSHAPHSQLYPAACAETYSTLSKGEVNSRLAQPPPPVVSAENTASSKSVDHLLYRSMHPPYHGVQPTVGPLPTSLTASLGGQVNPGANPAQRNLGLHAPPAETKPGRWNTMHVRVAWEIHRQQQLQQPDRKTTLASSIPSRLNFSGPSRVPNPYEPHISTQSALPPPPPQFTFGHNVPSFMSRQSSAQLTQRITTPPTAPSLQNLPSRRPSPAPDAWPRMAGFAAIPSTAPWLAPLARPNITSVAKSESSVATSSSSASMSHSALMAKEREWHKREERMRERERSESEREREKERTRHCSRSPLPHRTAQPSNGPLRNESPAVKPPTYPPVGASHGLPPLGNYHPNLQAVPPTAVSASSLINFPHTFDPFRDIPREMDSFRENLEREQREYLRMGAGSSLLHPPVGLGPPMPPPPPLFHANPPATSTADRYHDFAALTSSLSQDRFRDGLLLPGHLAHIPSIPSLPMPPSSTFSERYRELASYSGGMSGLHGLGSNPVYNTPVSAVMFPPGLAPPPLLSTAGLGAIGGMSLLPPLLAGAGKRTPPPSTLAPNLGGTYATLGRNHLGIMQGLGIPPYPLPSPSPMLQPHLLPPLGPGLGNAGASVGRSLLDMPMPGYNPLDFQRKDDSQNR